MATPKETRPISTGNEDEAGTPPNVQKIFDELAPKGTTSPKQLASAMTLAAMTIDNTPED